MLIVVKWFFHHWIWWFALFITYVFAGSVTAILEAVLDFKQAPREPMEWCHKHGYFRKIHTLELFPDLGGTAANSHVCPTCYKEMVFDTPNKRLKHG